MSTHAARHDPLAGIAEVLRRVLTEWGVPENIIKDNGQDYVSMHIHQILAAFAIHAPFVPHFTPEAKPHVERFFGTLARGLLEELPGYIGHGVADRKAIESRRTFADRILKKKETLEINLSPEELQSAINAWIERIYSQRVHSGLKVCPEARRAQSPKQPSRVADLAALEIVLMPEAARTVHKKGIKVDDWYQAAELGHHVGKKVRVKVNTGDITELYVYTMEGRHICNAYDSKARPMSVAGMVAAKKSQRKAIRQRVAAVKALGDAVPDPMAALLDFKGAEKKISAMVRKSDPHTNAALTEAARAAGGLGQETPGDIMRRECAELFKDTGTD